MEINKTYNVRIQGNLNTDNSNPDTVKRTIEAVANNLTDLINNNLPEGLIAVCEEES